MYTMHVCGFVVCKYGVGTGMGLSMWWYRVSMGVRVLMREGCWGRDEHGTVHRNRLLDGSRPLAMRSITTFEDRLENCRREVVVSSWFFCTSRERKQGRGGSGRREEKKGAKKRAGRG